MKWLLVGIVILLFILTTTNTQALTIEEEICSYEWDCETALSIVYNESRFVPTAVNTNCNPSRPYTMVCVGLFQIWTAHCEYCELTNPSVNIRIAYNLWLVNGFRPWGR